MTREEVSVVSSSSALKFINRSPLDLKQNLVPKPY